MAHVPQFKREVTPYVGENEYMRPQVNEDMFGVNVPKALNNLGQAATGVVNNLLEIKERVDNTKIAELANISYEWQQNNLYDPQNGYYYKVGKDAYGQSETYLKDYDKYMTDYIKNAKLSPVAAQRAQNTYKFLRNSVERGITSHDYKQGVVWSDTVAQDSINSFLTNASNLWDNPEEISKSLVSGYQAIEWRGEFQHLDRDTINQLKTQYRAQLNEKVLDSMLASGSLKASEYFNEHKAELNPDKVADYMRKVKSNEIDYTSREIAKNLIGKPLEEVYSIIDSISDKELRNNVMNNWSNYDNQIKTIQKANNDNFMAEFSNRLADTISNGGDANELKKIVLYSDLPFDVKQKQIEFIDDCVELGQEASLWTDLETIKNIRANDYEAFRKLDLSKFRLTKAEREQFLEEQRKVVDYSTEKQLRDMVDEMDTKFMWGINSLAGKGYEDELMGLIARIERLQGKAFETNDFEALKEGFDYETDTMPPELANIGIKDFKNVNETKELYMRAKAVRDIKEDVARSYIDFKNKNGRSPDPEETYGIVQRVYMQVARENWAKKQKRVDNLMQIKKGISNTQVTKVGYTPALTYFENVVIPQMESETGVKVKITSTYRASGKYGHEKGMKVDLFPVNPTKENILKISEYLLAHPTVGQVFCSNPYVLSRYDGKHSKFKSAVKYDNSKEAKAAGINHKTHFDITLSSQFGGTQQLTKRKWG